MNNPIIRVAQLNRYVADLLEKDSFLRSIQVRGELSGFKSYASGHLYFTLKDETASVSCVMFRGQATRLSFKPENGLNVIVSAKASLYDRDGRFQLYVQAMQPDGIGNLHLEFERLKARLAAEGLFDPSHKKPLPALPACIGVVTSPSGAVIRDIIHVLQRRFPGFRLQLVPVAVQGQQAASQIAAAIRLLNRLGQVDVILVGRGGGSIEDLWAFNEEETARAVYESEIPIVSAVGHETDYTICDFTADLRAPTPSAAAELVMPVKQELIIGLLQKQERMKQALIRKFDYQSMRLAGLLDRPVLKSPFESINRKRQTIDWLQDRLLQAGTQQTGKLSRKLGILSTKLDAMSPLKVLSRGYAVVSDEKNRPILSTALIRPSDKIDVTLQDGVLVCEVLKVKDRRML